MAGILDAFMQGYNFGDSIQQRQVDRQFQGEVRDRQRQEWTLADQDRLFGEAAREYQAIVGSDSLGDAVADPNRKQALVNWTNKYGKDLGLNDGALGNIEAQDFVPTGDGKAVPMLKASDPKTGEHISTGPLTDDRSNRDGARVVPLGNEDILGQIEAARRALRTKNEGFNTFVSQRETADQVVQALGDLYPDAPSTAPVAPSTAPRGLRQAADQIVNIPAAGPAPAAPAPSTPAPSTQNAVPSAPAAGKTDVAATNALIDKYNAAMRTASQHSNNDALAASNPKRAAELRQQALNEAGAIAAQLEAAGVDTSPTEIRPGVTVPRNKIDRLPTARSVQIRPGVGSEPRTTPAAPSTTNAVPSAKPEDQKARVNALTDDQAKKVAASVRAPSNERQLAGMQTQVENIRPSGQITTKQKKALAQLFRLGKIDGEAYERFIRTGRLTKRELEQVKTDSVTYVIDGETSEVVRQFQNVPQTTPTDNVKAAREGLKLTDETLKILNGQMERLAYGSGAKDATQAKQIAGRAMERITGTPGLGVLGIDVTDPTHQNYLFEANRLAQADEESGRPGWWASLFGAKDEKVNDLTPYVLDQMYPNEGIPKIAKALAAQKDENGNTPDREEVSAMLLHATRIAQQEKKSVGQVIQELSNAQ